MNRVPDARPRPNALPVEFRSATCFIPSATGGRRMATNPTNGTSVPLIQRVKNILITPKTEWPVIDAEPATIGGIYKNYVMILAAIPPICLLIGLLVFGMPYFAFPMGYLIAQAIVTYVMA